MTTLDFEPLSHSYYANGEQVPSVTHVIRVLEAYNRMSEAALAPYAQRGTEVHTLTEEWDVMEKAGRDFDVDAVPEDRAGYLMAWINFRADFDFAPTHIEHRVLHEKLWYAGTIDRIGVVRGKLAVVDIKTSARLGPAVGVQLAAYQHAFTEEVCESRYAVQLSADGTYRVVEYSNPLDWDAFRGCLALHTWQESHRIQLGDVRPRTDHGQQDVSNWPQFAREASSSPR